MEQKAWIRKRSDVTAENQTGMKHSANRGIEIREKNGVTYLAFPALDATGLVSHAFSTRHGGVSEGVFSTMNFSFTRNDDPEHVLENYRRMAAVLGIDVEKMVLSYQTHTTNVRKVTEEDAGKGIVKERKYQDVDGLITNIPGITLVTFYADCVPLYFVDPVHKAIGLSHSGWRGTVHRMGKATLEAMNTERIRQMSLPASGRAFVRTVLRWDRRWLRNLRMVLQSSTIKTCFIKNRTENIRWICGERTRSCSRKRESRKIRSTQRTSVPGAIRPISFPIGSWERSGEIWQRFWHSKSRDYQTKKSFTQLIIYCAKLFFMYGIA